MSNKFNTKDAFIVLLQEKQRDIFKRMQALRSESTILEYEISAYEYYIKELRKLLGDVEMKKLNGLWSFKDNEDEYERLKGLKVNYKGKEVSLFSESYLYDTIGKEDARTVLALLNTIFVKAGKVGGF
jgi:hypothetical protein